ncbi:Transcription factor IIIA [Linum grandiflorum]
MEEGAMQKEMEEASTSKDCRRYLCKYCGISRSKKYLIASHVLSHHKEEMSEEDVANGEGPKGDKSNSCQECGASFRKPAYLKEHLQSHSVERPFKCCVDGCPASYRRKDHLTRHLLQHEGKLFKCPVEGCSVEFAFQGNIKRHAQVMHGECCKTNDVEVPKQFACEEPGCGKVFPFLSKLKTHQDSHVKLDSIETVCLEPGCNKHFTNEECLKAHIQASHSYIACDICGGKQLKKNIKRHLRSHEAGSETTERVACHYKCCNLTFSTVRTRIISFHIAKPKTNLKKHVKAVHLEVKPFSCGFPGCGMRFAYKHVRDNHEKSGCHVYTCGDFQEADEQFRSRGRGGRKRECPSVETLLSRKRVSLPTGTDYCFIDR